MALLARLFSQLVESTLSVFPEGAGMDAIARAAMPAMERWRRRERTV